MSSVKKPLQPPSTAALMQDMRLSRRPAPPPAVSVSLPEDRRRGDAVVTTWRKARLAELVLKRFGGSKVECEVAAGRQPREGYARPDGSWVSNLISPNRPFGQRAAADLAAALGLDPDYFDRPPDDHAAAGTLVPLLDLGQVRDADAAQQSAGGNQVAVPWRVGVRAFAVVMPDDTMAGPSPQTTPISIPAGYVVVVDPDRPVVTGEPTIVCTRVPQAAAAAIRRLWVLDGVTMLRPGNPMVWDNSRMLTAETVVVGRVVGALAQC